MLTQDEQQTTMVRPATLPSRLPVAILGMPAQLATAPARMDGDYGKPVAAHADAQIPGVPPPGV